MRHGLFVVGTMGRQQAGLQRLAHAGHVAVAEDGPYTGHQRQSLAILLDALGGKVLHQRLGHGQTSFHDADDTPLASRQIPISLR
ncbi:hypothetical protein D3C83_37560 [compost metagenome]